MKTLIIIASLSLLSVIAHAQNSNAPVDPKKVGQQPTPGKSINDSGRDKPKGK